MKKLLTFIISLSCTTFVLGVELPEVIKASILDNVATVTQFDSRGTIRLALTDALFQIGSYKSEAIMEGQVGFTGDVNPESNEVKAVNFIAGGIVRLDTLLTDRIKFDPNYKFLQAIQHGPGYFYDFRTHESYLVYQVELAFQLEPKR